MSSTAVPVIRRGHAPRPADDPARRGSTVGRPGTASAQLLVLQRTAGNTAVRHLMREIDRERAKKDLCVGQKVDAAASLTTFTPAQAQVLRIVRQSAIRTCASAAAAVDMPGNESSVIRVARDYFGVTVRMTGKTRRTLVRAIRSVEQALTQAPINAGTCQDEHCNGGAIAHVDEARTMIVLCPQFFNTDLHPVYKTVRMLIHEAAHLANLDANAERPWMELYCSQGATKTEKCPVPDAIHNVDAWSHVIDDLSATI
jgi:hypothetical protein